jgi:hypothetical protein
MGPKPRRGWQLHEEPLSFSAGNNVNARRGSLVVNGTLILNRQELGDGRWEMGKWEKVKEEN